MKRFAEWGISSEKKIRKSLTAKTFAVLLGLFLLISSVTYAFVGLFLPLRYSENLKEKSENLVSQLRLNTKEKSSFLLSDFQRKTGCEIFLLNDKRKQLNPFSFAEMGSEMGENSANFANCEEYPFRFSDFNTEYILVIKYNSARSDEIKSALFRSLPWVSGVVIILSLSGAYLFSFYFTRRIKKMSNIARNMADLDFSWYCPDNSNDELGILAISLNELSDKLSNALKELKEKNITLTDEIEFEKERERRQMLFFSGVSHELKTPVAVVIGQLEGMQANIGVYKNREKYLARSAEILRSLDGFIREILSVSHIGILEKNTEKINISDILKSAINDNSELSEACEIKITPKIENDIFIYGDEKLLKKAFANVINNALIYTQNANCKKGFVEIISSKNTFKIINSPAHIDEKHLPHIFDAFYRADKTIGNGSGLGLYITRLIFETFGMSCKIENLKYGICFTIKI